MISIDVFSQAITNAILWSNNSHSLYACLNVLKALLLFELLYYLAAYFEGGLMMTFNPFPHTQHICASSFIAPLGSFSMENCSHQNKYLESNICSCATLLKIPVISPFDRLLFQIPSINFHLTQTHRHYFS